MTGESVAKTRALKAIYLACFVPHLRLTPIVIRYRIKPPLKQAAFLWSGLALPFHGKTYRLFESELDKGFARHLYLLATLGGGGGSTKCRA
jgi:hypothetical protein